jgi:DNA-binding NtrC family response regulator
MASILIVDDDEPLREALVDLFSEEHLCHSAGTAEEALTQIHSHEYDLIITDISMPGMSGEDLLGFIKSYYPRIPVIFISGAADMEDAQRLIRKGAFGYLTKPFRLEEIEEKVARAI